jgi:hypothetical protein
MTRACLGEHHDTKIKNLKNKNHETINHHRVVRVSHTHPSIYFS